MNFNYLHVRNAIFLLLVIASFSSILTAQKKPTAINLDANNDDDILCGFDSANNNFNTGKGKISDSRFCDLYKIYIQNSDDSGNAVKMRKARDARNEMIDLVRGQVDSYYKFRKGDRRKKVRWFQTILDFLEIGGATAIAIMNGERAKTVVGAAIAGVQGGRTALNKNFDILQTQTLINTMNANRSGILIEIVGNMDKPITAEQYTQSYPWYLAKNDLRRYLIAGTFDDALDTLIRETGAEAEMMERELRRVEKRAILREASPSDVADALEVRDILRAIQQKLAGSDEDKEAAKEALTAVLAELNETPEFADFFEGRSITNESDGSDIFAAIRALMRENADDDEKSKIIEEAIKTKGEIE